MKSKHIDWSILRGSAVIFVVVLLVSGIIAGAGYYYRAEMQQEYSRAQMAFQNISNKYLRVDEQKAIINNYYPRFLTLYQQGIIGPERRLDWLESLQKVADNLEIPKLRYEVASQRQSETDWPINTGRFQLYSSNMQLSMEMLHELDLLRLVDQLEKTKSGFFTISDCEMGRRTEHIVVDATIPNVNATCNIQWYSIKLSSGQEIEI